MDLSEKASQTTAISQVEIASFASDDKTKDLALKAETAAIFAPQTAESEAKTVQTVAASLSQVLAQASEEKLAQVAEVTKQVAVETNPAAATVSHETGLSQAIEQGKTVNISREITVSFRQARCSTLPRLSKR